MGRCCLVAGWWYSRGGQVGDVRSIQQLGAPPLHAECCAVAQGGVGMRTDRWGPCWYQLREGGPGKESAGIGDWGGGFWDSKALTQVTLPPAQMAMVSCTT